MKKLTQFLITCLCLVSIVFAAQQDPTGRFIEQSQNKAFFISGEYDLWGWSDYLGYYLGTGKKERSVTPSLVSNKKWKFLALDYHNTIGIRIDGSLWYWSDTLATPYQLASGEWLSASVGANAAYCIKSDSTLWGLGEKSTILPAKTTQLTKIGTAKWKVASTSENGLTGAGIMSDGSLWCWGYVFVKAEFPIQRHFRYISSPEKVSSVKWRSVIAMNGYVVAIQEDGTLWMTEWKMATGNDSEVGDGELNALSQVGSNKWIQVRRSGVGIQTDSTMWNIDWSNPKPVFEKTHTWEKWAAVSDKTTMAMFGLSGSGKLWSLGSFDDFAGTGWYAQFDTLVRVDSVREYKQIAPLGYRTYALMRDSTLNGFLSSGSEIIDGKWLWISGGLEHMLAVRGDSTLWAWGWNTEYLIGDPNLTKEDVVDNVQIGIGRKWLKTFVTSKNSYALDADSLLWGWGNNSYQVLGDYEGSLAKSPVAINSSKWVKVAPGLTHVLAISADSLLYAWGSNSKGQLGVGSTTSSKTPVQVDDHKWIAISAGDRFSFGIQADSTLWAWGLGDYLGLGDYWGDPGISFAQKTPKQVDGKWISISSFANNTLGMRKSGELCNFSYLESASDPGGFYYTDYLYDTLSTKGGWSSSFIGNYTQFAIDNKNHLWAQGANLHNQFGTTGRIWPVLNTPIHTFAPLPASNRRFHRNIPLVGTINAKLGSKQVWISGGKGRIRILNLKGMEVATAEAPTTAGWVPLSQSITSGVYYLQSQSSVIRVILP